MYLVLLTLALVGALIHIRFTKHRAKPFALEIVLLYLLVVAVGLGSLISGLMHVFNGPATAAMIGWPAGSPFQYEVGVADIALGLVAVLCSFIRGTFWLAAIMANSVYLLGCMIGHIQSFVQSGNEAAYNIGPSIPKLAQESVFGRVQSAENRLKKRGQY
jgi:hypothetical protein